MEANILKTWYIRNCFVYTVQMYYVHADWEYILLYIS